VGGSAKAVLAPNYERDVLFVDVHVSKGAATQNFLGRLEEKLAETIPVRPHWAKEFSMDHGELKERYPAESWRAFEAMKLKYDPNNLFSNAYTERVYGW
jgi:FAD/FMN-containing dehydrogenase